MKWMDKKKAIALIIFASLGHIIIEGDKTSVP